MGRHEKKEKTTKGEGKKERKRFYFLFFEGEGRRGVVWLVSGDGGQEEKGNTNETEIGGQ